MKTKSWAPTNSRQSAELGLTTSVSVSADGYGRETLDMVSALYVTVLYLRMGVKFDITHSAYSEPLATNRGGEVVLNESFGTALYVLEQCMLSERKHEANRVLESMRAMIAENENATPAPNTARQEAPEVPELAQPPSRPEPVAQPEERQTGHSPSRSTRRERRALPEGLLQPARRG
jgi:hypothetical protein